MAQTIKRAFFGVIGAAVVTSVVAAQTPQPSQTPAQSPTTTQDRTDMDDEQTVTVTGCLKEEADVPGFEPNVAERAGILEDFILTNARMGTASTAAGASAAGASASGASSAAASAARDSDQQSAAGSERSGSDSEQRASGAGQSSGASTSAQSGQSSASRSPSPSAGAGSMFKIEGLDDEELRQHANQQVEIRGKVDAEDLSRSGASTPPVAGADASQRDADDIPEIEAESIRMVAASCSPN